MNIEDWSGHDTASAAALTPRIAQLYAVLSEINEIIVRVDDRERLFTEACRVVVERGLYRMAWVGRVDPDTLDIEPVASCGVDEGFAALVARVRVSARDEPEGRGPTGTAVRTGAVAIVSDLETDDRVHPWRDDLLRLGYRATASFPIAVDGRVIGALTVHSGTPNVFDADETAVLSRLVANLAFALEAIEKQEELRYRKALLESQGETSVDGIVVVDPNGRIVFCNRRFAEMWNIPAEVLAERSDAAALRWAATQVADPEAFRDRVAHLYAHPDVVSQDEVRFTDGRVFERYTAPVTGASEQHYGRVWYFRDVTERRRIEAERERLRADAEQGHQRMALLARASHAFAEAAVDHGRLLHTVARWISETTGDACTIRLLSADGTRLEPAAAFHPDAAILADLRALMEQTVARDDVGLWRLVIDARRTRRAPVSSPEATDTMTPPQAAFLGRRQVRWLMGAPLIARGHVVGGIAVVRFGRDEPFTDDDETLLESLAGRAALAIDNARLYAAEQESRLVAEHAADHARRLLTVAQSLSTSLAPEDLVETIVDQAIEALGATEAAVARLTEDGATFEVLHEVGYAQESDEAQRVWQAWRRFPVNALTPMGDAVRMGEAIVLEDDAARLARYPHLAAVRSAVGAGAAVALPLIAESRPIGAMHLGFATARRFSDDERAFMLALARHCAQVLDRARLFAAERKARSEVEEAHRRAVLLAETSQALAQAGLDERQVGDTIAKRVAETMGDGCTLTLLSDDGQRLEVAAMFHPSPEALALAWEMIRAAPLDTSFGLGAQILATGEPALVSEINPEQLAAIVRPEHRGYAQTIGMQSLVAVPLQVHGKIVGVLSAWRDTAGRPYTQDDLLLLQELGDRAALAIDNARLYRQAQVAIRARDDFLSIAVHELKTPVTTLKGNVQFLARIRERNQLTDVWLDRLLTRIGSATERLAALVNDLLDIGRVQAAFLDLRTRSVDVRQVVEDCVDTLKERLVHRRVTMDAPAPCVAVVDPDRLVQVLENVLDNAVKFSPAGGAMRIVVRARPEGALVSVSDEGIGLPHGATETIFGRFGRAANAIAHDIPGMGLGLYISRSIVERHGGRMWAESPGEGQGTTISLLLPWRGPSEDLVARSGRPPTY